MEYSTIAIFVLLVLIAAFGILISIGGCMRGKAQDKALEDYQKRNDLKGK